MGAHFTEHRIKTRNAELFALTGGSGPPLLLLHGYPQNHIMWRLVAPELSGNFSLVMPDLPGYGDSQGPPPEPTHVAYSKRAVAAELIDLMAALGHDRFSLAGHDRGGRVAYRLALDHPERVTRLAVLNIVPTIDVWEQIKGPEAALKYFNWLLLAQPTPVPERLVGSNLEFVLHRVFAEWAGGPDALEPAAVKEYVRHFSKPSVLAAACEDYRAGATIDLDHDRADREVGRRIGCATLVLWGQRDFSESPLATWRRWADDLREVALDCGHFLAEEKPAACASALREFFAG
jgi:haloacetate dehalogenase